MKMKRILKNFRPGMRHHHEHQHSHQHQSEGQHHQEGAEEGGTSDLTGNRHRKATVLEDEQAPTQQHQDDTSSAVYDEDYDDSNNIEFDEAMHGDDTSLFSASNINSTVIPSDTKSTFQEMERFYGGGGSNTNNTNNNNTNNYPTPGDGGGGAVADLSSRSSTTTNTTSNGTNNTVLPPMPIHHSPGNINTSTSMSRCQETRDLVKKFIADIWNRGELDLIPSVCSPSLRFNGNTGFDRVGHVGLARMVATIRDALDEYHCEIHSMVVEDNKAFCRLRFTGKHVGILCGHAPTQKTVAWMGATEFTCQNGKILKVWELGDVKSLEEQLSSRTGGSGTGTAGNNSTSTSTFNNGSSSPSAAAVANHQQNHRVD